ncbi:MAG: metallophosphoesterase [Polyangia bacterium]
MERVLHMAVFLLIGSSILAAIHYYLWRRLVRDTALNRPWRKIATGILIGLAVSVPFGMAISREAPFQVGRWISLVPYSWLGAMLLLLTLLLAADLLRLAWAAARRLRASKRDPDPTRRLALARIAAGTALLGAGGLTAVAAARALATLSVRRVEIPLRRLPAALDGFRIVQICDLHVGSVVGREWVERVAAQVRRLQGDLVAVTGDLVDGSPDRLRFELEPLAGLEARWGVFFVTGNHEYYSGAAEWVPELERMGMRVLRNERVRVGDREESFDLIGIDDYDGEGMEPDHGPDLPGALAGRDPDREAVLLAHQPRAVHEAAELGVGLVLSGHTHGGQLWPWNHLVGLQQPYVKGLHHHGPTQIYVSEGTGVWGPPLRLGTTCEITELTLRRAGKPG